jgi:uncharacterized protein (TIRG00374 family)
VKAGRWFRASVAVGLTALLLWKSDPGRVWRVTAAADAAWLVGAVMLVIVDRVLMAGRWFALLSPIEAASRPPLAAVVRVFFVSTFVGTFLPASIGGDLVRAYQLSRYGVDAAGALASVLMDRLLGVVSIVLLAGVGLVLATDLVAAPGVTAAVVLAAAACVASLALVFNPALARLARWLISLVSWMRLQAAAAALIDSIQRYARHRGKLFLVLAASAGVQMIRIAQAYALGRAIGIEAPALVYIAVIPLILLIMLLPITVNGLGTSQAAFVWFFGRAGVDDAEAFALSVLFVGLGIVGNLPGGLLYAFGRSEPPRTLRT